MNKLVKASIAGAAGFALLLGGAGTLASWNSSITVNPGVISAGTLSVTQASDGAIWKVAPAGSTTYTQVDINNYLIVPGDKISFQKTITVNATGDNLHATLSVDPSSLLGATPNAEDVVLAHQLAAGYTNYTLDPPVGTNTAAFKYNNDGTVTINAGHAGVHQDITLGVTFTFPTTATAGHENDAQGGHIHLNGVKVNLTQK